MGKAFITALTIAFGLLAQAEPAISPSCTLFNGHNTSNQSPIAIEAFRVVLRQCQTSELNVIGLREFKYRQKTFLLVTNPNTLKTDLVDKICLRCKDTTLKELPDSVYRRALQQQILRSFPLFNDGITHAPSGSAGYFLTVDLCPSHRLFEKDLFGNPKVSTTSHFPVAISVSGPWMAHHQAEFLQLKNQDINGQLNITWVNHSYTHPYDKSLPDDHNFLLMNGVVFADEVLKQEQYMIANGLTPSVYFRFPGLISERQLILDLTSYGLLSLGSDAWLALGEQPKPGSIILVHGNGNEPYGIHLLLSFLQNISDLSVFKSLRELF